MKPFTFICTPLLGVVLICLSSCGDQDSDTTSASADSTATADSSTAAPASTITTTPQHMMVVRHKVADFDKWIASYDAHDSLRLANGIHSYVVGRSVKDPNTVFVSVKVDDINKGKAFAKDPALKQAMKKGGVVGAPVINLNVMTFRDTGMVNSDLRSRSTFRVKDWDNWQRTFDSARQTITDNGLVVRSYGHDVDDNHKVTIVSAVMDTAKANAFWKSDELKKIQAASGVTSQPERFIYRVAKRH